MIEIEKISGKNFADMKKLRRAYENALRKSKPKEKEVPSPSKRKSWNAAVDAVFRSE